MSGESFNYQNWTKAVTKVTLVELDLENMAEGRALVDEIF
jgi:hypothetical protein